MTELYTRGGQGLGDDRGEALMARHANKLQKAKEDAALLAIRRLQPDLSPAIWVLALEESDWDPNRASDLMNAFKEAKSKQLSAIQNSLRRLSQKDNQQIAESESGSESERQPRKRKSKDKDKKKHKHSKKKEKKDKPERREKSEKKRQRREEKGQDVHELKGFGAYGIIAEKDLASKYTEFALWSLDIQNVDVEVLPKNEEKELFRTFCEDYNTATLPHRKYYDLEAYERQKAEDEAANRESDNDDTALMLNDEAELKRQQAAERAQERQDRLRDAYLELKHRAPGKAEDMREQALLRSQMALAYRTGDRDKAAQIAERLKPDEVKEREAAKRMDPDNPGPMP